MCIPDGTLRARLDGELGQAELAGTEEHLRTCARCRERAAAVAERAGRAQALFSELGPEADLSPADAAAAYARLEHGRSDRIVDSRWRRLFPARLTPAWGAVAAVALVAVLATSAPTRSVAQRLLGLFRVKAVVAVPMERDFGGDFTAEKRDVLQQVLADSMVTLVESRRVPVAAREEATKLAGFDVQLPALRQDQPQLAVITEHKVEFTVSAERVRTLLSVVGRTDLNLPAGLDGAKVLVDAPAGVMARYGECPDWPRLRGQAAQQLASCMVVVQSPGPTVVTTPELDLTGVAEFGLQLTGMTPEQAHTFAQTVDWTSTAAIPIPRNTVSSETVSINGTPGILLTGARFRERTDIPPSWVVLWVKGGMMYSVTGFGDTATAVPLAESLR